MSCFAAMCIFKKERERQRETFDECKEQGEKQYLAQSLRCKSDKGKNVNN